MSAEFYEQNGFKIFKGTLYTFDDELKLWLVQAYGYDVFFSKQTFAKAFIGLLEYVTEDEFDEMVDTYDWDGVNNDSILRYLAIKIGLREENNNEL